MINDPASFEAFYHAFVFAVALYLVGDILCGRFLSLIPPLVGQIVMGIVFGPFVLDIIHPSWITLGNLGLALLICQAGMDMDFDTLRTIGPRSVLMAIVGSILPIGIGMLLAYKILNLPIQSALAVGCSFGPTSAGIAMNVLGQCGVLKKRIGQLVVAIAIFDDIIALVVLSQLRAITGEVTIRSILIPIVSALSWLSLGGWVALVVLPNLLQWLERFEGRILSQTRVQWSNELSSGEIRLDSQQQQQQQQNCEEEEILQQGEVHTLNKSRGSHLWHAILLLLMLLPATYYSQASYLMGAFLVGLSCCQIDGASREFAKYLSPLIEWLMRIFFACTIGFSVPVILFGDPTVIRHGLCLSLALLGKVATGPLLTPVFDNVRYGRQHWQDCAIVGFSMAGEAEFAFLVAQFGYANDLFSRNIYASVVLAVLSSTIVSPVLLRITLASYSPPLTNENEASQLVN